MALIKCPGCGHDLSDKAYRCPHCGYIKLTNQLKDTSNEVNVNIDVNNESIEHSNNYHKWLIVGILVFIPLVIVYFVFNGPNGHQNNTEDRDSTLVDTTEVSLDGPSLDWKDKIKNQYGENCQIIDGFDSSFSQRYACIYVPSANAEEEGNSICSLTMYDIDKGVTHDIYKDGTFENCVGSDEDEMEGHIYKVFISKDKKSLIMFAYTDACSIERHPLYILEVFNDFKVKKITEGSGEGHCLELHNDCIRVEKWILKDPDALVEDRDYYINHEYYDLNGKFIREEKDRELEQNQSKSSSKPKPKERKSLSDDSEIIF